MASATNCARLCSCMALLRYTAFLVLLAAAAASSSTTNTRQVPRMLVTTSSDTQTSPHETTGYTSKTDPNTTGPFATTDLPVWDPRIVKKVTGLTPEQVSVNYWSPGTYLISWTTGDSQVGVHPTPPDAKAVKSVVMYGTQQDKLDKQSDGTALTYTYDYSSIEGYNLLDYASPVIHHTFITPGVKPGTTVFYKVGDPKHGWSPMVYNFTVLPDNFPFTVSVMADSGQSYNTSDTLASLLQPKRKANMLWNVGDLSYADNINTFGTYACWLRAYFDAYPQYSLYQFDLASCPQEPPEVEESAETYQPRWDYWARLFEPLFAFTPVMHVNGNHEMENQPDGRMFVAYNARYPTPQDPSQLNTKAVQYWSNRSVNNMYSSAQIPGVATVIFLTSFQPLVKFGSANDLQFQWLKQQLAAVDRSKTPWLIVNFHYPWYTTDPNSFKGNECMRQAYEPLLLSAGVDIVFNGHVHAYERSYPVANFSRSEPCGIVHIVVGSAGNDEGLSATPDGWLDQRYNKTNYCTGCAEQRQFPDYQPQRCFSFQPDENPGSGYCPNKMPSWLAFRDTSFGSGTITFKSSTEAVWEFYVNENSGKPSYVADRVTITKSGKCGASKGHNESTSATSGSSPAGASGK